jgi:hypothetical protein
MITRAQVFALLDNAYQLGAWLSLWVRLGHDFGPDVRAWVELCRTTDDTLRLHNRQVVTDTGRTPVLSILRGDNSFVDVYYPAEQIGAAS